MKYVLITGEIHNTINYNYHHNNPFSYSLTATLIYCIYICIYILSIWLNCLKNL